MGVLVTVLEARILDRLGDMDPNEPRIQPYRLRAIINAKMHTIAARTIRPRSAVQSITLVVGTYDYALASSGNVANVAQVLLDADGSELCAMPFEDFNSIYKQATSDPHPSGQPTHYTLWETTAQVATLRVGPTPDSAGDGPIKVYASILPELMSNAAYATPNYTTTTIPFSNELIIALESACAAEVLKLAETGIKGADEQGLASRLELESEMAIRSYNQRQLSLGRRQDQVLRRGGTRWPWHSGVN